MNDRNSPVRLLRHVPNKPGRLDRFPEFTARVQARLEAGAREYGDRSFDRGMFEQFDEIREELLDLMGWVYVVYEHLADIECRARDRAKSMGYDRLRELLAESPSKGVSSQDDHDLGDEAETAS